MLMPVGTIECPIHKCDFFPLGKAANLRRTPDSGKKALYGWTLVEDSPGSYRMTA